MPMSQKTKDFLNVNDPSSLGKPPAPAKPEPFKSQPLGYKDAQGNFIATPQTKAK